MGDGSWLFPLVRRNGHDRQFARVRGIACRAAYSGHGGVRRLPLLRKDFGAPRSGSGPRIRKRAHRRGSGMWPRPGNFLRRDINGALRLAPLLHCPGPRQHGLADSLVCLDAGGQGDNCLACDGTWRGLSPTPEAAFHVGNLRWPVWRKLCSLFRDYLAALLPRARAALSGGHHG